MTRTLDGAGLRVEIAVRKRPVVVRAAVLDRVDRAAAVEHADLEILPFDQLAGAGRELGYGADVDDLGHGVRKSDSCGRICPFSVAARGYATSRGIDPDFVSRSGGAGVLAARSGH